MGDSVALAAITLAGTCVAGVIWVVKYLATKLTSALEEHTAASVKQTEASKKQTEASQEVLVFMRNLNGRLEAAAKAKLEGK